jgi:hypothetical protein
MIAHFNCYVRIFFSFNCEKERRSAQDGCEHAKRCALRTSRFLNISSTGKLQFPRPPSNFVARPVLRIFCIQKDPMRRTGASSKVKIDVSAAALRARSFFFDTNFLKCTALLYKRKPRRKAGSTRFSWVSHYLWTLTQVSIPGLSPFAQRVKAASRFRWL